MSYDRTLLPDPVDFYESQGMRLAGKGKWQKALCPFHDDHSPSLSINTHNGAFACFACGTKGGDIISFLMQRDGLDFISTVKQLGAWRDDGKTTSSRSKPLPLPARDALEILKQEALICAVLACDMARGIALSETDKNRVLQAAGRIQTIGENT